MSEIRERYTCYLIIKRHWPLPNHRPVLVSVGHMPVQGYRFTFKGKLYESLGIPMPVCDEGWILPTFYAREIKR